MIEPFKILRYDTQGEFPDGCVAVRIAGPGFPVNGLPFMTAESEPERYVWAARWCKALNSAYMSGQTSAGRN